MKIEYNYLGIKMIAEDVRDEVYLLDMVSIRQKNLKILHPYMIIEDTWENYLDPEDLDGDNEDRPIGIKSIEINFEGV